MQRAVLEDLVDRIPDCRSVSYANMMTKVTFLSAGVLSADQLKMEQLCAKAETMLGPVEREDGSRSDFAALVNEDAMHLFLRSTEDPEEVITCSCGVHENAADVLQAMQNAMVNIHVD